MPTLVQAGYGVGIVLVSPLGDLVRRRPLVLLLYTFTCVMSIPLALAPNANTLTAVSFIVGLATVTPQIAIPWTADLAPANIRARSMSITISGLISGLVMGRLFGGVIANYANWRDTYWLAVGLQGCKFCLGAWLMVATLVLLWLCLPDTPDKDLGISYFGMVSRGSKRN